MSDRRRETVEPTLEDKVRFLSRADSYPDAPDSVTAVETHMSWVFLTDRYVYKLKRPVRHSYLDFSTLADRRRNCELEVRLNRRLAADVYLGIVPVTRDPDGLLHLAGAGAVVEWLVKMRRLPGERMLDEVIRTGAVDDADLCKVADVLADFYRRAPRARMGGDEFRSRLAQSAVSSRDELCNPVYGLPRADVEGVVNAQLELLDRRPELFRQRIREGRVVEGHGDLRPQHVCLTGRPVIIDCLEFNRDFRLLDSVDELAYLAVECERLGAPDVGQRIMTRCSEATGDAPPEMLVRFYKSLRACLRARLAVLHTRDDAVRDHPEWLARAGIYLRLARGHITDAG